MKKKYDVKCVIVGTGSVGKTSFTQRLVHDKFDESTAATVGVAYQHHTVTRRDGVDIRFELWDTAGQERYRSLTPKFFRGAHCAIIVYDLSLSTTFNEAKKYTNLLIETVGEDCFVILVGNKLDLQNLREVDRAMAQEYAEERDFMFTEMSAKNGTNVQRVVTMLAEELDLEDLDEEAELKEEERKSSKILTGTKLRSTVKLENGEFEGEGGGKDGCKC